MVAPVDPKCTALKNAMDKQGITYSELAGKIGDSVERLTQICVGQEKPTEEEFKRISTALGLADNFEHSGKHATTAA